MFFKKIADRRNEIEFDDNAFDSMFSEDNCKLIDGKGHTTNLERMFAFEDEDRPIGLFNVKARWLRWFKKREEGLRESIVRKIGDLCDKFEEMGFN